MKLSVIGLGKLGGPMAVCFADRGFEVIGVDKFPAAVQSLAAGQITEPGMAERLQRCRHRLELHSATEKAVRESQATFMIVPTPSDEKGDFSVDFVLDACGPIGRGLKAKDDWHLVVLTSTVMPQDCRKRVIPALEAASGKRCGQDFGFCYSPEFIALGSFVGGFLKPDLVLIGESDERAGQGLDDIYRRLVENEPQFMRTSLVNAEIAKIGLNTYVTMKISFANTLARMCEQTPGAEAADVSQALGYDSRIGRKYLRGALAYGGPCFPRDTVAFANFAESVGLEAKLARTTHQVNLDQRTFLAGRVRELMRGKNRLGVLGLSYKPGTPVLEESPSIALLEDVTEFECWGYDPMARPELATCRLAGTAEECVQQGELIVVITPWDEFKTLSPDLFQGKTVLDCWGLLDRRQLPDSCEYSVLGESFCLAPR